MRLKVKSSAPFELFNTHRCCFTRAFPKKTVCSYFVMFFLSSSCFLSVVLTLNYLICHWVI